MKILITGANGFIGKNLITRLNILGYNELYLCDRDTEKEKLIEYTQKCDFVFHFAGVINPQKKEEYMEGNFVFTYELINMLKEHKNHVPVLLTSTSYSPVKTPFVASKRAAEDLLNDYSLSTGADIYIYRLPSIFGKWATPNYSNAVATICYNVARDTAWEVFVGDMEEEDDFIYIEDVIDQFICCLGDDVTCFNDNNLFDVPCQYKKSVTDICALVKRFVIDRENGILPDLSDDFTRKLYNTFLTYLPVENIEPTPGSDIFDIGGMGQITSKIVQPGEVLKNRCYFAHSTKYVVLSGNGVIRVRTVNEKEVREYHVDGSALQVVDVPIGCASHIENSCAGELVVLVWTSRTDSETSADIIEVEV